MRQLAVLIVVVLALSSLFAGQKEEAGTKNIVKLCTPKVVKFPPLPKNVNFHPHEGEKTTGYSPVVAFQILESGQVENARLTRSSGYAFIDKYAVDWIRGTKYNNRSGCGTTETESSVSIHWRAAN